MLSDDEIEKLLDKYFENRRKTQSPKPSRGIDIFRAIEIVAFVVAMFIVVICAYDICKKADDSMAQSKILQQQYQQDNSENENSGEITI